MKITSKVIKTALLCYFKFKRNAFSITEFSYYYGIADVMAFGKKDLVITEVEVKVAKQDLLNEVKQKKGKHDRLKANYLHHSQWYYDCSPNKFYFCVEEELKSVALKVIEKINPRYGLMIFKYNKVPQESIYIVKRAYSLHKNKYTDLALKEVLNRMNNENCTLVRKLYWNKNE